MKTFIATKVDDNNIELADSQQLEELYNTIESEENFILEWMEGSVKHCEVKIANNMRAKVKNADILLTAKSGGGKK